MPDRSAEPPVDLATVRADDALLDSLALGDRAEPGDNDALADLLADWHADLSADVPEFALGLRDTEATVALSLALDSLPDLPELRAAAPSDEAATELLAPPDLPVATPNGGTAQISGISGISDMSEKSGRRRGGAGERGRRRPGVGLRRTFAAVAAGIVILAGLALGAERSGPNSPLWPLTQVLYPETAHARAAEQAIAEAGDAIAAGRYDDARRLLDTAENEANQVDNPGTRRRLLDQIADLRAQLPPTTAGVPQPSTPATTGNAPATEPAPATPTPAPGATTPGDNPGGGATTPGNGGDGQIIPGLPTQIVPTGPVLPLPTQIVPTVPGLPLPTGLG